MNSLKSLVSNKITSPMMIINDFCIKNFFNNLNFKTFGIKIILLQQLGFNNMKKKKKFITVEAQNEEMKVIKFKDDPWNAKIIN